MTRHDWTWIDSPVLLAVHDEQLAEHGGAAGTRAMGLFESAIARPRQLAHYGEPDAAELAAAYAFGIARNHLFVDGNKRTAFVAAELFLALNGLELIAEDADCVVTMLAAAAGQIDESAFARWLREHSAPR
ncbi:MAG TPA: type II toxin-antitoxin system death-on-curing family toxin [Rubrivivax sp.]|nr:type II toxin-antitoxin system death-on-curing family toxin [Rubrivivax sp.]